MRPLGLIFAASFWGSLAGPILAQDPPAVPQPSPAQQPNYQPGWPCTGKERSFDPTYAKVPEATGGHLVLLDRSEVGVWATLAIGVGKHNATMIAPAAKTDPSVDLPSFL